MKLVCAQNSLSTHLSIVSRAVATRATLPVLANVLLVADEANQQVRLSAFDLSLGIQTSFAAQVEVGGKLTLPARLLNDIVSRLPEGDITLEDDVDDSGEANWNVTLTSKFGRYQVRGMSAEEFPELPVVPEGDELHLASEALIDGLRGALFAASDDETKQVLTGVHLTMSAAGLEFAATDGHRLAVVETVSDDASKVESEQTLDVTIPAKALQELAKMVEKQAGSSVAVKFDQSQAVFEWADQRLTSRLLEGQYPNYRQLIPRQFARQLTVDRRQFLSALERIAVLADQKNNIVKLSLSTAEQEATLSVDAPDVGSGRETIAAQITGEDLDIAFNVKYLLEGLKVMPTTEIQMQLNTATSPAILSPLGGLKATYLVMPVQIRS
ncbi:MAG TPA: DNA polymerase III subunit beta [Microcoleaceae cyanobacterium]|jgi:DNA polymerase-3 subunit beta